LWQASRHHNTLLADAKLIQKRLKQLFETTRQVVDGIRARAQETASDASQLATLPNVRFFPHTSTEPLSKHDAGTKTTTPSAIERIRSAINRSKQAQPTPSKALPSQALQSTATLNAKPPPFTNQHKHTPRVPSKLASMITTAPSTVKSTMSRPTPLQTVAKTASPLSSVNANSAQSPGFTSLKNKLEMIKQRNSTILPLSTSKKHKASPAADKSDRAYDLISNEIADFVLATNDDDGSEFDQENWQGIQDPVNALSISSLVPFVLTTILDETAFASTLEIKRSPLETGFAKPNLLHKKAVHFTSSPEEDSVANTKRLKTPFRLTPKSALTPYLNQSSIQATPLMAQTPLIRKHLRFDQATPRADKFGSPFVDASAFMSSPMPGYADVDMSLLMQQDMTLLDMDMGDEDFDATISLDSQ
jgi:hypothetical protein